MSEEPTLKAIGYRNGAFSSGLTPGVALEGFDPPEDGGGSPPSEEGSWEEAGSDGGRAGAAAFGRRGIVTPFPLAFLRATALGFARGGPSKATHRCTVLVLPRESVALRLTS